MKKFRDNGAVGAILDEYEKAVKELIRLINNCSIEELITIVDTITEDEDCRSIQTILSHVVRAGFNYVVAIRKHKGENLEYKTTQIRNSIQEYVEDLDKMFDYNMALFSNYPELQLEQTNPELKIKVGWGNIYDVEQLFEHAIVHVLRHRRQIERFIIKLRS